MSDSQGIAPLGRLEIAGNRYALHGQRTTVVGRSPLADVAIDDDTVSWEHAEIGVRNGALMIWDRGSLNGTSVEGERIDSVRLRHGVVIHVGDVELRFFEADRRDTATVAPSRRRYPLNRKLAIGRAEDNDIVLDGASVSRHHALLLPGSPTTIQDLGSRNGTWLDGSRIGRADLRVGDEIGVGPYRLVLDDTSVAAADQRTGSGLRAVGAAVAVGSKPILKPTTLTVGHGELLALIGSSGSGKSTLLRTLAGISAPTGGEVLLDDHPILARRSEIGYVPQEDVIHDRLTVREALTYAAVLRLPKDTETSEIADDVDEAIRELGLTDWGDELIASLSGGQRKRVSVGVELVGQPSIVLLDEPTSGLDPPLEHSLMRTIRSLADDGRGVVVTTHATSSLALCDALAIMLPGGRLGYVGPPQEALKQFDVQHYDQLYQALPSAPPPDSQDDLPDARRRRPRVEEISSERPFGTHLRVFGARYMHTLLRDRRTLVALLGQVPVIAVLVALLFPAGLLHLPDVDPGKSAQFVFLLVTASLWLGLISSCREIVNERLIVLRELSVGATLSSYICAKAIVLFALAALQTGLLLGVSTAIQPLHAPLQAYVELYVVLLCTAWAAIALGLVVSTYARSVDQATSFVPLLLIPQLLFAGALVTVQSMQPVVKAISALTVARWGFAGGGSAIDLNERLATDARQAKLYGDSFFALRPGVAAAIVLLFVGAGLLATAALLRQRRAHPG